MEIQLSDHTTHARFAQGSPSSVSQQAFPGYLDCENETWLQINGLGATGIKARKARHECNFLQPKASLPIHFE